MNSRFYFLFSTFYFLVGVSMFYFLDYNLAFAERLESDNFIIPSDTITPGEFSSSDNFRAFINITQISERSSSDNFDLFTGFLSFPEPEVAAATEAAATKAVATTVSSEGVVLTLLKSFLVPKPALPTLAIGECGVDLNCDGNVNVKDLGAFLYFMTKLTPNPADFNRDKVVNSRDLSRLFFGWTDRFLIFEPEKNRVFQEDSESVNGSRGLALEPKKGALAEVREGISDSFSSIKKSKTGLFNTLRRMKEFVIKLFRDLKSKF